MIFDDTMNNDLYDLYELVGMECSVRKSNLHLTGIRRYRFISTSLYY